jgi:hypothetical protein
MLCAPAWKRGRVAVVSVYGKDLDRNLFVHHDYHPSLPSDFGEQVETD